MKRNYFSPVPKRIYEGSNGDQYICISSNEHEAALQEVGIAKWTFTAHNCYIEDGKICWENSTDGFFAIFDVFF